MQIVVYGGCLTVSCLLSGHRVVSIQAAVAVMMVFLDWCSLRHNKASRTVAKCSERVQSSLQEHFRGTAVSR